MLNVHWQLHPHSKRKADWIYSNIAVTLMNSHKYIYALTHKLNKLIINLRNKVGIQAIKKSTETIDER